MRISKVLRASVAAITALMLTAAAAPPDGGIPMERATMLSAFGERAAFSPDGTRVAFVGKSYGDAYEIELATGHVRNLTGQFPHQGVIRVQYLSNGDYLIVGPKRYIGPNSRLNLDLFVLSKDLRSGLQPLDENNYEGVAMGPGNMIAWQRFPAGSKVNPGETWLQATQRLKLEHYVGRVDYRDGKPVLVEKRRILTPDPTGCGFKELQDFRNAGNEVTFYCGGKEPDGSTFMGIFGYDIRTQKYTNFYKARGGEYAEVEGIAPDGKWSAVECGMRTGNEYVPPLDICRLELVPNGKLSRLIIGTAPGSTKKVSNPVISPDGKWIAFQAADTAVGDIGEGGGIYIMRLPG